MEQPADPTAPTRFMVVDDDASFRTRLMKALSARGYDAHGAGNLEEAMVVAARVRPQRAVIDLRMPGRSGLELVAELATAHPDLQMVVLTGYGSIATAVDAVKHGAIDYLQKPVDTEQILAAFEPEEHATTPETPSLARVEWEHIQRVLNDCEGNISLAARKLGLHRRSLQRKLGKLPPLE